MNRSMLSVAAATALALASSRPATALVSYDDFALPAGTNPQGLAAADCDGDGLPDVLASNFGDDTVTIFRNDGRTLAYARTAPAPSQPGGATCADVNGDGHPDLAVSSFELGTLSVYLGAADGTLTPHGSFAVGAQPRSVAAADFDRDGNADLLVVNARTSGLTLLFGDGTGAFPFASSIRVPGGEAGNRPQSAAVGDYDHDGLPDIAIVGQGTPPLRILLGDGLGFAIDDEALPATANPRSAAGADLDGDGLTDLAILSTDATVRLYRGTASRRFAEPELLVLPSDARAVTLADFDGNGLPDLAVAYAKSNTVQVMLATGPGRFRQTPAAASLQVNDSTTLISRSGGDEVIAIDKATRRLTRLKLDDHGTLATSQLATLPGEPQSLVLTDLDADGLADAVLALRGPSGPMLQVQRGSGSGGFDAQPASVGRCGDAIVDAGELCDDGNAVGGDGCGPTCTPEIGRAVASATAADVDGDGRQDVVLTDVRGTILGLLGNGRGAFRAVRRLGEVRPRTPIAVAPFRGEGTLDIVAVPKRGGRGLAMLVNDGGGRFTVQALPQTDQLRGPFAAADVDRNGFVDLIATPRSRRGFVVLYNDGDGPRRAGPVVATAAPLRAFGLADADEDGWLDLFAFFTRGKAAPALYRAVPGGGFQRDSSPVAPQGRADAVITDLNEDQHHDLVQCDAGSASACTVAYGDGRGRFSASTPLDVSARTGAYVGRLTRAATAADFDGDGVVDFAAVSKRDNRIVVVYRQQGGADAIRLELVTGSKPIAVATADLDGDGRQDLIAANEGSADLSVFLNRGPRTFHTLARVTLDGFAKPSALAVGDADGDGRLDLVVVSAESAKVMLVLNRGGGGLVRGASLATGATPEAVAVGDVDGDGTLDVATANGGDDTVSLFLARGGTAYEQRTIASGGRRPTDLAVTDLDGDGTLDVAVVHEVSRTLVSHLNDGTGELLPAITRELGGRKRPWNLCSGDFDGDGIADVAVASLGTADVTMLRGSGDGDWRGDVRVFSIGEDPRPLVCRDVDGDQRDDVLFVRRKTGRVDAIVTSP